MYVLITPPFESPDEFLHLDYINYVSKYKSLPNQYEGIKNPQLFIGQGHQYPLYYIITSIPVHLLTESSIIRYNHPSKIDKNWKGGSPDKTIYRNVFLSYDEKSIFYLIRLISVFFSVFNLYFIFKISELISDKKEIFFFSLIIAASIPQFQFISSVINNDSMANLFATISVFYFLHFLKNPLKLKNYIFAALFTGFGIIIKKTILFLIPLAIIIFLFLLITNKNRRILLINSVIFIIIVFFITSFIFLRNYVLYNEFLAGTMEQISMPQFVETKQLFSYYFIQPFSTGFTRSFIGVFGWMNVPLPLYITVFYVFLLGTGLLFSLYKIVKLQEKYLLFLLLSAFICLGGVIYFNLTFTQYQGRYLFPVISAICVLSAFGIIHLLNLFRNEKIKKYVFIFVLALMITFDILSVVTLYNHYY